MTTTAMTMPAMVRVPVAACLVVEVRWGHSRILTRALRWGALFHDPELAQILGVGPWAKLAERTDTGFLVHTPNGVFPLSVGEHARWSVGEFHAEARVDQVLSAGSMAWLVVVLTPVILALLSGLAFLIKIVMLLVALWLRPVPHPIVSHPVVAPIPLVHFEAQPAVKPIPPDLKGRVAMAMKMERMNEILAHPMKPKVRKIAKPRAEDELVMVGVLKLLGSAEGKLSGRGIDGAANALAEAHGDELAGALGGVEGGVVGGVVGGVAGGEVSGLFGVGGLGLSGVGVGRAESPDPDLEAAVTALRSKLASCGAHGSTIILRWAGTKAQLVTIRGAAGEVRSCLEQAVSGAASASEVKSHRTTVIRIE